MFKIKKSSQKLKICIKCNLNCQKYQQNLEEKNAINTLHDPKLIEQHQKHLEKSFEVAINFNVEERSKPDLY